eukprot:TRINITY_DN1122_c0_g1_i7.p1 TRINITY_DN1122_c0_g1~~TRINITY_DN1122_c0_g1_i7.p1  ORF type:complete len:244 (-),score=80.58 TRINITY_DN1122_c0_g1_i7:31-762(-)
MCIRDRYMGIYIYLEIAINISQNPDFVMQLTRADSTVVSSTHQYESTIIPAPPGKLWTYIRNFALDKVLPSRVDKIEYVEGSAGKVDSVLKISFKDSASWSIKILELSDLNHYITYEVIEASPPIPATSILNTIRLRRVTDDNSTFLTWETDFSNDADANVIQDNKYKKLEYFKEIKTIVGKLQTECCLLYILQKILLRNVRFYILLLSLIHISEPTRLGMISYAVFCLKKKKDRSQLHGAQL